MEERFPQVGWQSRRPGGYRVVKHDGSEHRGIEQRRKVVMEVQDAAHGPEGNVVKGPADEQPDASIHRSISSVTDFGSFIVP